MGLDIDRDEFTPDDFERFAGRLEADLRAMESLLARPGFGRGPASIGAELELHLVDEQMRPSARNIEVRDAARDARVTLELNRFNLEFNALPNALAGRPFAALRSEFEGGLSGLSDAASAHGCRLAIMGILPTLAEDDLGPESRTPLARFRALSRQLRQLRGEAFEVRVDGIDPLRLRCSDVTLEGANTSWQLHLRVDPDAFAAHFNAAQLATGPVLAISGNSPHFVGHRLWDETRVALFKQSVDPRTNLDDAVHTPPRVGFGTGWTRHGALEHFQESVALHRPLLPVCGVEDVDAALRDGRAPKLEQLRLHHGTVWGWNRAVYDPVDGGDDAHLRIELRAMAAGPTLTDMLANSAFALGLTLQLSRDTERWLPRMPFELARHNFYRGAQHGLDAELMWPSDTAPSPRTRVAAELVRELVPLAAEGLSAAGVDEADFAPLLSIIEARAECGQTGARWQRRKLDALRATMGIDEALARLLQEYLELSESDRPVHEW